MEYFLGADHPNPDQNKCQRADCDYKPLVGFGRSRMGSFVCIEWRLTAAFRHVVRRMHFQNLASVATVRQGQGHEDAVPVLAVRPKGSARLEPYAAV